MNGEVTLEQMRVALEEALEAVPRMHQLGWHDLKAALKAICQIARGIDMTLVSRLTKVPFEARPTLVAGWVGKNIREDPAADVSSLGVLLGWLLDIVRDLQAGTPRVRMMPAELYPGNALPPASM